LLRAVAAQGYTRPTPIQLHAIPAVLSRRDILAGAQTGTGKTAAFTLPMLQLLSESNSQHRSPRSLVLTPTRELAAQVGESVRTYGRHLPLRSMQIFGGVGMGPQVGQLRRGVDIVVATPGRLLDHAGQHNVDLSMIEFLVLDEADRMLDMGFIHDIRRVIKLLPRRRQSLMFSATYSREIERLAKGLLDDPVRIEVARRNTAAEMVQQLVCPVAKERKHELLSHLIRSGEWRQVLVFTLRPRPRQAERTNQADRGSDSRDRAPADGTSRRQGRGRNAGSSGNKRTPGISPSSGQIQFRGVAPAAPQAPSTGMCIGRTDGPHSSMHDSFERPRLMNIYVGNLAYGVTQDELRGAFGAYGKIESVNLITDKFTGESKGFGFVEMSSNAEAGAAIKGLNETPLKGRNMKVNQAKPRGDRPSRGRRF
jgi:hypothetical protein